MKKWYKQSYFNRHNWILENIEKLNINANEALVLLLIEYSVKNNIDINYEYLCKKMALNTKTLDDVLASLVQKHYLTISSNDRGIYFDIDNLFEFDVEELETIENTSVYDILADFFGKPLVASQLQKTNDLIHDYGENKVIDAIRMAEAYRKPSLAYIEGILRNGK